MDETAFFTTPLFADSNKSNQRFQRPQTATSPSSKLSSVAAPPSPHVPCVVTTCVICAREDTCYKRPVEDSWFCSACAHNNHAFATVFDQAQGFEIPSELHCFSCGANFNSYQAFAAHCQNKSHRKRVNQSALCMLRQPQSRHSGDLSSLEYVDKLRTKLVEVLHTFDTRFRRHLSKEQIRLLPKMKLYDSWESFESRCFSHGAASTAAPTHVDVSECGKSGELPFAYRVVHVHPGMQVADFDCLLHQLRTERLFGFDTETAPSAFYPHVARVNPRGPHLIQLATRTHVWLISTTTMRGWKNMERVFHSDRRKSFPAAGSTTVASPVCCPADNATTQQRPAVPTVSVPAVVSEKDQSEVLDALLGSHDPEEALQPPPIPSEHDDETVIASTQKTLPADAVNIFNSFSRFAKVRIVNLRPDKRSGVPVTEDPPHRRLPQFIVDFLHRRDVALLGFSLSNDIEELYKLMDKRTRELQGSRSPVGTLWNPPCLDLSLVFSSDMVSSRDECPPHGTTSGIAVIAPSSHMSTVGTVQAAARVFGQRFEKGKHIAVSNWATPSKLLPPKQLIYACRDAIVPLFMVDKLLELADQRKNGRDRATVDHTVSKNSESKGKSSLSPAWELF